MKALRKTKPLYQMIIDDLKEQIRNGDFEYNAPITTEQKLAERYHVSRITAMRALEELDKAGIIYRRRGSGSFVTSDGILKIDEEAAENSPSVAWKKENGVTLIAMVLPFDIRHGGMMECLNGINDVLNSKGYYLRVYNSCRSTEKESEILRELIGKGIDGIICYPFRDNFNAEVYNHCTLSGIPLVLIDRYVEGVPVTHVISDNFGGTKRLTESIIDKGHKRIAFISEGAFGEATPVKNRYLGYITAMHEKNLQLNLELVKIRIHDRYEYLCGKNHFNTDRYHYVDYLAEQIEELYRMGTTAIVCENDWVAREVIGICGMLRISVPDRMSVAGFDNINRMTGGGPELASVEQDFYTIGRIAAQSICRQIANEGDVRIRNVVPVKVIEGTTVKKLN